MLVGFVHMNEGFHMAAPQTTDITYCTR